MTKKIVVINRHVIAADRRSDTVEPPIRVSRGKYGKPSYHCEIEFNGRWRLVYDPAHLLPCGATAWLELDDDGRSAKVYLSEMKWSAGKG